MSRRRTTYECDVVNANLDMRWTSWHEPSLWHKSVSSKSPGTPVTLHLMGDDGVKALGADGVLNVNGSPVHSR